MICHTISSDMVPSRVNVANKYMSFGYLLNNWGKNASMHIRFLMLEGLWMRF